MPHNGRRLRLGIVGAGAACVTALYELFDRFHGGLPHITVIDGGAIGTGNVFAPDLDCALVNRQAKHMSVLFDRQDDFVKWAQRYELSIGNPGAEREYYSRSVFGRYLQQRFDEICVNWRAAGAPIEVVRGYADSFDEVDGALRIGVGENSVHVDFVILCTGHGRRTGVPATSTTMLRPYPLADLVTATQGCHRVAVVGAGLTAIDSVLGLLTVRSVEQISMFSRTGILPDIRADFDEDLALTVPERSAHQGATLDELRERFHSELNAYGVTESDLRGYIARLRGGLNSFMAADWITEAERTIQNLAISMANRDVPTYWHGFSDNDRDAFDAKYFRLMQAICSPIPLATAETLRAAIRSGRLQVGVGEAAATPDGWLVGDKTFDAVVDGTGTATSAEQERFEHRLVAAGLAIGERYGGIRVDFDTGNVLSVNGEQTRLYAIGYATRGSLLYSSSLYQATRNVKGVVADIARAAQYSMSALA